MNILKLYNLNSMTLKKIENFDGKDFFYGFLFVRVKFHGQVIIRCGTF
jgi:hypothetical protein